MENILGKYVKQKETLLQIYDELVKLKFVPCKLYNTETTEKDVKEHQERLLKEEFIITVCGQIKSGKSTLLNYLLFNGDDILPTDDTPYTAKLTIVRYGREKCAKVCFYTEAEWQKIKESTVIDDNTKEEINYFKRYLEHDVDRAAQQGIYDKEFIHDRPYELDLKDLKKLGDYVSKDGLYTPFVKNVEIIITNEFIKDVTVVDTPGLNDPNELRSSITCEWIKHSNAVVYLFYVGQSLGMEDFSFIDRHLAPIPSRRIIFALTKVDLQESKRVKDYIEVNLRYKKELKDRYLLEGKEVYPVSTMAAIIADKVEKKVLLNDDEEFYHKNIKDKFPGILENKGNLAEFKKIVEHHLMKDKGDAIIETHQRKIQSICETKINEIKRKLDAYEDKKRNISLTYQEKEKKKNKIIEIRDKFSRLKDEFTSEIDNQSRVVENAITVALKSEFKQIMEKMDAWISDSNVKISDIIYKSTYKLKSLLEEHIEKKINEVLQNKKFQTGFDEILNKYEKKISELIEPLFSTYLKFKPIISLKEVEELIDKKCENLTPEKLEKMKKRVLGFLRLKAEVRPKIFNEINNKVDEIRKGIFESINGVIAQEVTAYAGRFMEDILDILNDYDDRLVKVDIDIKDKAKEISNLENKIAESKDSLKVYEDYFGQINGKIMKG